MTFTNTIKVDVGHPWKTAQVYVKQGDKDSRKIRAELMNGAASWTIPVGTVATFRAKKPDDTVVTQDATIGSPNIVEVVLDEQVGAVFGVVRGEIRLVNGGEILNTFLIAINVEAAAVTDGDIVSRDVLDEYQALVEQMLAVAGSPLVANAAADMTDKTRVYVYTGSEVGYVTGDWYYWDGAAWTAGGAYNSQGISDAFIEQTADYIRQSTVATESDRTPYLYRPTPNPSAILADEEIVGGTVAFNQLQVNTDSRTSGGVTYTFSDGKLTASTGSGTATTNSWWLPSNATKWHWYASHVYYIELGNQSYTYTSGNPYWYVNLSPNMQMQKSSNILHASADGDACLTLTVPSGKSIDATYTPMVFDLTAMFGSTIAEYILSLETGTPGAGVAKLREWGFLSKPYYAYDAGSLVSVNTEGKRVGALFSTTDADLMTGYGFVNNTYLKDDGTTQATNNYAITRYFKIKGGVTATITHGVVSNPSICFYDAGYGFISGTKFAGTTQQTITIPANAVWCRMSKTSTAIPTELVYTVHEYHTTPTDLNGLFKLDANNNLYADGDRYKSDGTITRKWKAVDMGSMSWTYSSNGYLYATLSDKANGNFNLICGRYTTTTATTAANMQDKEIKGNANSGTVYVVDSAYTNGATFASAMSGVYIAYELATPTTETATPYTACQIVGKGGTEEWIDNRSVPVPVGHETVYGIGVPDVPANASNATLKATVSGGKTTLSWS